ncbi:DUF397 domain-containing protein [Streptomyces gamaensis]|uniref:DUF397 domain-containing protein n=1 Tax=Streptomyces gamaensis TaxID=1763542 RepID=A0ABW0Z696_9ACTN
MTERGTAPGWRRSSFSGSGGGSECVEAAVCDGGLIGLRESEAPQHVLLVPVAVWAAFARTVRAGGLRRGGAR